MEIYTITQARTHLSKIIEYTQKSHAPVYIFGKKRKAVLISEEDYIAIQMIINDTSTQYKKT